MHVFDELSSLTSFLQTGPTRPFKDPRRVLMVTPHHFDIKYSINPHMLSASGQLQKIDKPAAENQWKELVSYYRGLGIEVETLPGSPELPDMVFAANHGLVWQWTDEKTPHVLMGRMRSNFRQPEIALFENWYLKNGYQIHHLEEEGCFEGNGDALLIPSQGLVLAAYGPRSDEWIYSAIAEKFQLSIVRLELVNDEFYHLDTCLSVLSPTTAVFCPAAIAKPGREMVYSLFENIIEVELKDAKRYFSCNSHSPDGRHLVTQIGDPTLIRMAGNLGFKCTELESSEFIKAGGSIFCLKMMVY